MKKLKKVKVRENVEFKKIPRKVQTQNKKLKILFNYLINSSYI